VSLNVALADHCPDIIERCCELGWEFFGQGVYNTRFLYGLDEERQIELISDCKETIRRRTGQSMDGWLSPHITPTEITQNVLAKAGVKYTLDLYHDDHPMPVKVEHGRMISVPYSVEVNDAPLFLSRNLSTRDYESMLIAQFNQLYREGEESGTVMCIPLHPFLIGQPHRIGTLERILQHIVSHDSVWLATGREIAAWYDANYYDTFTDWLKQFETKAKQ
jgi:peptidoglycan/xylan/chitin deacetylase (PgdA/CDA1 family)